MNLGGFGEGSIWLREPHSSKKAPGTIYHSLSLILTLPPIRLLPTSPANKFHSSSTLFISRAREEGWLARARLLSGISFSRNFVILYNRRVTITDANDNAPEFEELELVAAVPTTAEYGHTVTKIQVS